MRERDPRQEGNPPQTSEGVVRLADEEPATDKRGDATEGAEGAASSRTSTANQRGPQSEETEPARSGERR